MTNRTPAPAADAAANPAAPAAPIDDPEILALLDFEAVPRKRDVEGGWTAALQREFIARLAVDGSPGRTCDTMGKDLTGITRLYRSPLAESFRAAWDGAVTLAKTRQAEAARPVFVGPGAVPPSLDHRRKLMASSALTGQPGQVMNELGQWEDEDSLHRRAEAARDSITKKLLNARRLYLAEISDSPAKRAAFEILTELPIDWEAAANLEPQADEPWRRPRMRDPDMMLAAEAGWLGDAAHGPDKKAELMRVINEWRVAQGQEPVDWGGSAEDSEQA
jgi:hypothetical protein